jgi:TfoX/Sxy family transcriptional regulator of competence genes
MAYNLDLAERVRRALVHLPQVEEKKMFGGLAFLVNGKMCVSVGDDYLMCRVDPRRQDSLLEKTGSRPVIMNRRLFKGYIYVSDEAIRKKDELDYWIGQALDFNPQAKSSKSV